MALESDENGNSYVGHKGPSTKAPPTKQILPKSWRESQHFSLVDAHTRTYGAAEMPSFRMANFWGQQTFRITKSPTFFNLHLAPIYPLDGVYPFITFLDNFKI